MVHTDGNDFNLLFPQSYANFQNFAAATKASLQTPLNRMKPQEKMPPRFNVKGMSVAVRVLGHEIRHVTYKTTGKDLAELRYSCPDILRKISQVAKEKRISFATLTIPKFDFSKRNLNEFDFNGYYATQRLDSIILDKNSDFAGDERRSDVVDEICTCSSFQWSKDRINESELKRMTAFLSSNSTKQNGHNYATESDDYEEDWEVFMKLKSYNVSRKKLNSTGKYLYKIHGSFSDVCAKAFYQTQIDNGYRCLWDSYALSIDTVDKDPSSPCEIVRWTTKCPYPMKSREYLFLRNAKIFEDEKIAVVLSRSAEHPKYPENEEYVRVDTYESKMAIKPFKDFDQNGMEFVLVYSEDPQTVLPSYLLDMLATSGITEMMSKLHRAAKELKSFDEDY